MASTPRVSPAVALTIQRTYVAKRSKNEFNRDSFRGARVAVRATHDVQFDSFPQVRLQCSLNTLECRTKSDTRSSKRVAVKRRRYYGVPCNEIPGAAFSLWPATVVRVRSRGGSRRNTHLKPAARCWQRPVNQYPFGAPPASKHHLQCVARQAMKNAGSAATKGLGARLARPGGALSEQRAMLPKRIAEERNRCLLAMFPDSSVSWADSNGHGIVTILQSHIESVSNQTVLYSVINRIPFLAGHNSCQMTCILTCPVGTPETRHLAIARESHWRQNSQQIVGIARNSCRLDRVNRADYCSGKLTMGIDSMRVGPPGFVPLVSQFQDILSLRELRTWTIRNSIAGILID